LLFALRASFRNGLISRFLQDPCDANFNFPR
jgi:hypothetical protein